MTQHNESATAPKSRIPEFTSWREEAEFWDTHDLADFWDELRPVELRVADKIEHGIMVYFDGPTLDQFLEFAEAQGVKPGRLGAAWIADRLEAEVLATAPA